MQKYVEFFFFLSVCVCIRDGFMFVLWTVACEHTKLQAQGGYPAPSRGVAEDFDGAGHQKSCFCGSLLPFMVLMFCNGACVNTGSAVVVLLVVPTASADSAPVVLLFLVFTSSRFCLLLEAAAVHLVLVLLVVAPFVVIVVSSTSASEKISATCYTVITNTYLRNGWVVLGAWSLGLFPWTLAAGLFGAVGY